MSILHEAILESKKLKEEALELAKKTFLENHKAEFDKLATNLIEQRLNDSDESDKETLDTRTKNEVENYLDKELSNDSDEKDNDYNTIEIEIDTDDNKKSNKKIDLSDEEDSDEVEKAFSSIGDDDEIIVVKSKKQPLKVIDIDKSNNDDIKNMMKSLKEENKLKNKIPNIMEKHNNMEDELTKEYNNMTEEEKSELLDGLSEEELFELANELVESMSDEENMGDEMPDEEASEEDYNDTEEDIMLEIEDLEEASEEDYNDMEEDIMLEIEDLEEEDYNDTEEDIMLEIEGLSEIESEFEDSDFTTEQENEVEMEEGVGIDYPTSKRQRGNKSSYEAINHSRSAIKNKYEVTLGNIKKTFEEVSKETKKLQEENNRLKKQLGTLNESENKLRELNSEYSGQLSKYKEKCYEALLEAKKAMCVNKILLENSTTKAEKQTIIEAFTNATTSKEIDVVNKYLLENISKGVGLTVINESTDLENLVSKTSVLKSGSGQLVESTTSVNPKISRMLKSIEYMEGKK